MTAVSSLARTKNVHPALIERMPHRHQTYFSLHKMAQAVRNIWEDVSSFSCCKKSQNLGIPGTETKTCRAKKPAALATPCSGYLQTTLHQIMLSSLLYETGLALSVVTLEMIVRSGCSLRCCSKDNVPKKNPSSTKWECYGTWPRSAPPLHAPKMGTGRYHRCNPTVLVMPYGGLHAVRWTHLDQCQKLPKITQMLCHTYFLSVTSQISPPSFNFFFFHGTTEGQNDPELLMQPKQHVI